MADELGEELLAALEGLRFMVEADRLNSTDADGEPKNKKRKTGRKPSPRDSGKSWIIATDSQYVVKGITEWLPSWKNNNLRTNRDTKPSNLDLFLKLDEELTAEETKQDVKIGFWHVRREYNTIADGLAKKAALDGEPEGSSG
ncbi:MAG: hypothetical protein LQ338_007585 [Usnochroma carphineum]|nr:MAG: hypothetical protein LQ338_007585 [Usnochroma carphineum]